MRRATVLAGRPTRGRAEEVGATPVELNSKHPFQINEIFTGHGKLCKLPVAASLPDASQSTEILHTPAVAGLPNNREDDGREETTRRREFRSLLCDDIVAAREHVSASSFELSP